MEKQMYMIGKLKIYSLLVAIIPYHHNGTQGCPGYIIETTKNAQRKDKCQVLIRL